MQRLHVLACKEQEPIQEKTKLQTIIREISNLEVVIKELPEEAKNWVEELRLTSLNKLDKLKDPAKPDKPALHEENSDDPDQWNLSAIGGRLSPNREMDVRSVQEDSKMSSEVLFEGASEAGDKKSFLDSFIQMGIEDLWMKGKKANRKVRLEVKVESE
eukprot:TRINITY_DN4525_c0_g1_i26.p1 TRINITY_DN4525_c0_g1~~TRINITY_DN4525_c0_g1_i26.p1  ORF type:complete len:159 (+),score=52.60 TRINITY_DN4525_c0_g1_i26:361-837(+)